MPDVVVRVEVFVPEYVNPVKLARMRSFGAHVTVTGVDSAASEAAARDRVASSKDCIFVEDGKEPAIAEGAGTIGIELLRPGPLTLSLFPSATARSSRAL
jgi:threonine dehydratase